MIILILIMISMIITITTLMSCKVWLLLLPRANCNWVIPLADQTFAFFHDHFIFSDDHWYHFYHYHGDHGEMFLQNIWVLRLGQWQLFSIVFDCFQFWALPATSWKNTHRWRYITISSKQILYFLLASQFWINWNFGKKCSDWFSHIFWQKYLYENLDRFLYIKILRYYRIYE